MKMTGRGMNLPLDSFEVVPMTDGFMLGESAEKPCFFKTMEFDDYIFRSVMKRILLLRRMIF